MKKKTAFPIGLALLGFVLSLLVIPSSLLFAQQKAPYRIGVNMDITGYAGWGGEPSIRAIQLYAEQVNAQGGIDGRPIELVIQDNETNPEKSTTITKKLIQRDKVLAIMGPSITATTNAARGLSSKKKRSCCTAIRHPLRPTFQTPSVSPRWSCPPCRWMRFMTIL